MTPLQSSFCILITLSAIRPIKTALTFVFSLGINTTETILLFVSIISVGLFLTASLLTIYFIIKIISPVTRPLDTSYLLKITLLLNAALFQVLLMLSIYAITYNNPEDTLHAIELSTTFKLYVLQTIDLIAQ